METKINASSTMFLNRKPNKVGTGRKMISMVNAVLHGTRPQRFKARFMMPGLTNYPGEDGTPEMWWLPREVMTKMQKSFIGCPVVLDADHNGESTPENFEKVAVGVVSDVWTGDDGWDWCNMVIWDQETMDKIQKGWNVSCAYNTTSFNPGGVLNAIDYEHEVTEGEYIHMAIVPAPRQTGARIFLNSLDKPSAGVIIFHMNGKMYKLHPKGKTMRNVLEYDNREEYDEYMKLSPKGKKVYDEAIAAGKSHIEAIATATKLNAGDALKKGDKVRDEQGNTHTVSEVRDNVVYMEDSQLAYHKSKLVKTNAGINKVIDTYAKHVSNGESPDSAIAKTAKELGMGAVEVAMIINPKGNKNEGGDDMTLTEEQKKAEEEAKKNEEGKEDDKEKLNDAIEIDPETAVIETPEGEVSLKELVDTYQAEQVEVKKKEELEATNKNEEGAEDKKDDKPKISMDDEFDGVPIKTMYESYKKNKSAKKNEEDENADKLASRRAALKSEGKSDEEAEEIIKNEAEAAKDETKVNHFNSMRDLKNKPIEAAELKSRLSSRDRIKAARAEY